MVWINPDNFLSIGHFSVNQRIDLAKMVNRLIRVSKMRLNNAEMEDIISTCFLGILEAYDSYGSKLTPAHCTNYARSKLRDTFFSKTKTEDAMARHGRAQTLRSCDEKAEIDHEKELLEYDNNPFLENPFANAKVRWTDTGRTAKIDASALIHSSDSIRSDEEMEAEAKAQVQRMREKALMAKDFE